MGLKIPKTNAEECGISAFSKIITAHDEGKRLLNFLANEAKTFRLYSKGRGLDAADIGRMARKCGYYADYRFNSQIRTFTRFPLPSFVDGIVAVKRRNSDASHWLAWVDGKLIFDNGDVMEAAEDIPGFDGFGHRIALWRPGSDTEIIRATSATPCHAEHCSGCFRFGSCCESK